MSEITTIGIDIAKHVFQLHGVDAAGKVVICRRLRRSQVAMFFAALPPCLVGMEACGTAHFWAREIGSLGHDVRPMPPSYVKPYVKRNKHDTADCRGLRSRAPSFHAFCADQDTEAAGTSPTPINHRLAHRGRH